MATPVRSKSSRQAVLVMGMHRSGTSALSGILGKLGVQPPRTLMPPTDDNPRGYWESTKLMGFHDALLRSAGSTWSDWDAFNPDWIESSVADTFRDRLPELIGQEFGDAPLFLVKDPRISRFARFWLDVLTPLSIVPKVVICVRHPWEVAQSLETRNDFGRKRAQLIWLRHMLDAEHATRGVSRSFVHYGALLQNWAAQVHRIGEELDIRWPRWSSNVEMEIDRYLTSSLRRNVAESGSVAGESDLDAWVATSYRVFLALSEGKEPTDEMLAQLDAVRRAFDATSAIYGAVVREQELRASERIDLIGQDLAKETEQAGALRKQLETAAQELDSARAAMDVREGEMASRSEANRAGEAERVRLQEEYQATISALTDRLNEREAELKRLVGEQESAAAVSAATVQGLKVELQVLRETHAAATDATVQGLRAELQALRDAHLAAEAALSERDNQLARLGEARDADAEQHAAVLAAERQTQAEVVARLTAAHASGLGRLRDAHSAALGQRDREREALEATLEERFHELAHLSRLLLDQESKAEALQARLSQAEADHEATRARYQQELEGRRGHERRLEQLQSEHAVVVSALKRAADEKQQALDLLQERMDKAVAIRESRYAQQSRKHAGQLAEMAEMAAGQARELARREDQIARQQVYLDVVNRELRLHRDDIRRLSGELHAVRHSRSRQLAALLRGERKAPPPEARPLPEQARIIRESGRFDVGWYLSGNPDVVASGIDPVLHYLEHGAREGRNPAPDFDTGEYVSRHPGLAEAGTNPLLHLVTTGAVETGAVHDETGAGEEKRR